MKRMFIPGDILLPRDVDMKLWSVIACDQYTAQPEYWDSLSERVGESPSTLRLIFPEAFLETHSIEEETKKINTAMADYLTSGIFETIENSFIYIERDMTVGEKRRGILGLIDLEAYDYSETSESPIHCTEGTVESRLPPRVKVREAASLELPHVVVFVDDPENTMFRGLEKGELLYDFDLIDGGGHICGRRVQGAAVQAVEDALEALSDPEYLEKRYALDGKAPVIIAMGDGNHSLATAKMCWERLKPALTPQERENHPARFGLAELVNIHDRSIEFEPIHRVIFDTDTRSFFSDARKYFESFSMSDKNPRKLKLLCGSEQLELTVCGHTIGDTIAGAQRFVEDYVNQYGGKLDYIHDDEAAVEMSAKPGCCGLLMPCFEKKELFESVIRSGAFPAKSFSIGPSRDKRYYLECRKIK